MTDQPVIVVGDANVDLAICLPQRDAEGHALEFTQREPQLYGGGSAANAAVALARLALPVAFVGTVGDDGYGRFTRDDLAREGIDVRGLRPARDALTPMVIAMIEPNGERMIVVWPPHGGADKWLRSDDLDRAQIAGAAWLHTSGMVLRDSPVREAVLAALETAHAAGVPVSLDLNLRLELWGWGDDIRATLERAIPLCDVIFGNADEEIVPLVGAQTVEAAAQQLSGGQRVVVARRGAEGVLAAGPEGLVRAPAFLVEVVDTLGAGDAFDGGFIAARLAGQSVAEALRWGNAVAALKIGRAGARGLPTRAEVERLLARG